MVNVYEVKDGKSFYKGSPIVSVEEELSTEMVKRLDELDEAGYNYLKVLSDNKDIDMLALRRQEILGSLHDFSNKILNEVGFSTCYPYISNIQEKDYLLCIHCDDCQKLKEGKCSHTEDLYEATVEYDE